MLESAIKSLNLALPMLYCLATAVYAVLFFKEDSTARKATTPLLVVTVLFHFIYLVLLMVRFKHLPFANVFEAISTLAFAVAIVYLYIEFRTNVKTTGWFVLFIVFSFQLISSLYIVHSEEIHPLLISKWFVLHTSLALLGYSAFATSAVFAFLYLMLYHQIKWKRFGVVYSRLPSLEILTDMNQTVALFGFVLLAIAVLVGMAWSNRVEIGFWRDPKFLVAIITLLIYGFSIAGRRFWNWQGKRVAYLTLLGFAIIVFSLMVVNLLFETFHSFSVTT